MLLDLEQRDVRRAGGSSRANSRAAGRRGLARASIWKTSLSNARSIARKRFESTRLRRSVLARCCRHLGGRIFALTHNYTGAGRPNRQPFVFASVPPDVWDKGPAVANAWIKAHLPPDSGAPSLPDRPRQSPKPV